MDIREYVKFKKIPGGSKSDCEMISGVVFTKNIANKKMSSVLHHPRILVLSCAIDYQVISVYKPLNPDNCSASDFSLSPDSDQHQFSPNNIHMLPEN